jgi:LuxR family transcriptional regulator, maltose regulon positive regulatory protein
MRTDADQAARRFEEAGVATGAAALLQGIARILSGDLDGGDAAMADAVRLGQVAGTDGIVAEALAERSLVAMARGDWTRADDLAGQARATLRLAAEEESYIAPLACAVQARAAIHRGDAGAARRQLVSAQRARPLLTYAIPHIAVQARIELTRAHLALGDTAGARTLLREIDDLLKQRPQLGTLVAEAEALRTRIAAERSPSSSGASSLTAAELRIVPLLATHLSYPEIAAELFVSPNTIKSQAYSIFRKLGASSRSEAVIRSRELELLDG